MNYSQQQPNGAFTVADQTAFCKMNAGTRLIGAPDRPKDKEVVSTANYSRADARDKSRLGNLLALQRKGYSVLTVNRNRNKKNHRN